eukprot:4113005-Pleurochrysis_carterae.AAC.2
MSAAGASRAHERFVHAGGAPSPTAFYSTNLTSVDLDSAYPPCGEEYWTTSLAAQAPWLTKLRGEWLGLVREAASELQPSYDVSTGLPLISTRLHQTWKDASPPRVLFSDRWRRSVQDANAGWEYRLWTDAENRELVANHYSWFLHTYDSYASAIQVSFVGLGWAGVVWPPNPEMSLLAALTRHCRSPALLCTARRCSALRDCASPRRRVPRPGHRVLPPLRAPFWQRVARALVQGEAPRRAPRPRGTSRGARNVHGPITLSATT